MNHPLALICYNRPQHLNRVIQALIEIKPGPLYVFSDGPKNDADVERVKQVRHLLLDIKWTAPVINIQEGNRGLAKSIVGAVDYLLERHETAIILEDDCVPGLRFMDFMVACLEKYRDDGKIMSISGYAYPLPEDTFQGYPYHAFAFPRPETWGWATWRGAWKHYIRDGELAGKFEEAKQLGIDLKKGGNDIPAIIRNKLEFGRDSWSPGWLLGTAEGLTIYPTQSHVEYIGDDGSGVNMPSGGKWRTRMFDGNEMPLPDDPPIYGPAYQAMKRIFDGL